MRLMPLLHSLAGAVLFFVSMYALAYLRGGLLTEYWGVRLGAGREDVRYIHGSPPFVLGPWFAVCPGQAVYSTGPAPTPDELPLPAGKRDGDFDDWAYGDTRNFRHQVIRFESGRVATIECYAHIDDPRPCPSIEGIRTGDTEAKVRMALGQPTIEHVSNCVKTMWFEGRHLTVKLEQGRVYGVALGELVDPDHEFRPVRREKPLGARLIAYLGRVAAQSS
jgi:hypothetical protein